MGYSTRRARRARGFVSVVLALAVTLIGGAAAASQAPAPGTSAHGVTIPAVETPPTGHPTATPVAEEPENRIVTLFRGLLIAAIILTVGVIVTIVLLVRAVKRRASR
jgi:hypothetical protein